MKTSVSACQATLRYVENLMSTKTESTIRARVAELRKKKEVADEGGRAARFKYLEEDGHVGPTRSRSSEGGRGRRSESN